MSQEMETLFIILIFCTVSFAQGKISLISLPKDACLKTCAGNDVCSQGCDLWNEALSGSCETSCGAHDGDSRRNHSVVNCRQGCDYAVNDYVRRIEGLVGNTSKPHLVWNTTTATSVQLEVENYPTEMFPAHVQWRLYLQESGGVSEWKYFNPHILMNSSFVDIGGLQPYTFYQFRIGWIPTMRDVLWSKESNIIQTLPSGAPTTPPANLKIHALTHAQIFLRWDPPTQPNGKLLYYELQIRSSRLITPTTALIQASERNYTFGRMTFLTAATTYHINVTAITFEGKSPPARITVITPPIPSHLTTGHDTSLLYAVHNEIRNVSNAIQFIRTDVTLFPFNATMTLPPPPNPDSTFGDFVFDSRRKTIFLAKTNRGGGREILFIDLTTKLTKVVLNDSSLQLETMSYDWLNHRMYYIKRQKIMVCDVGELMAPLTCQCISDSIPHLRKIIADPINGYLFWLEATSYDGSAFYRLPLIVGSIFAQQELTTPEKIFAHERVIPTFDLMFDSCKLVFGAVMSKKNVSAHGMRVLPCDGRSGVQDLEREGTYASYLLNKATKNFVYFDSLFVWTAMKDDYPYVMIEEFDKIRKMYSHNEIQLYGKHEFPTGMRVANVQAQPNPYPSSPPINIQLHVSSDQVRITWNPPSPLPWQSASAWNSWNYSVSLDGRSEEVITNRTELIFTGLNPDTIYTARIHAFSASAKGPVSQDLTIRTFSNSSLSARIVAATSESVINMSVTDPNNTFVLTDGSALRSVSDIIWAPDFVAVYLKSDSESKLVIIPTITDLQVQQPDHQTLTDAQCFAYDWIGKKFYWSSLTNRTIQRSTFGSHLRDIETLVYDTAKQIVLDPLRGTMYWSSGLVVETAKLSGQHRQKLFALNPLKDDKISAITIDYKEGRFYIVIQRAGGNTEVRSRSLAPSNLNVMELVATLPAKIGTFSVAVFDHRIMWIDSKNGNVSRFSVADFHAPEITLNFTYDISSFAFIPEIEAELRNLNRTFFDFQAVPGEINAGTIEVAERGNETRISWPAVTNCNYGNDSVQYDVDVTDLHGSRHFSKRVAVAEVVVPVAYTAHHLQVEIRPVTDWGNGNKTTRKFNAAVSVHDLGDWSTIIIVSVLFGVIICAMLAAFVVFRCGWLGRRYKSVTPRRFSPDVESAVSPLAENLVYGKDSLGIDLQNLRILERIRITLIRELGRGEFGEVHEADFINEEDGRVTTVAVKKLKGKDVYEEFLSEAVHMSQLDHKNIIKLYGVCVDMEPYYIVMEYMDSGDLLRYLRDGRPGSDCEHYGATLTMSDLLDISRDVAEGCAYLQANKYLHRDLAARNCLVTHEHNRRIVKISDFGLARDIYQKKYYRMAKNLKLPVRWMSPESLIDHVFTGESDVWSFGVVMWEIMTYGTVPYNQYTNDDVVKKITKDHKNPLDFGDHGIPEQVTKLMRECWSQNKRHRPTFQHCVKEINRLLAESLNEERSMALLNSKDHDLSKHLKSISYPNISNIDRGNRRLGHSSPDLMEYNTLGSADSGFAITPGIFNGAGELNFVIPPPPKDDSVDDHLGYVPVNPAIEGPPPYLKVHYSVPQDVVYSGLSNSPLISQVNASAPVVGAPMRGYMNVMPFGQLYPPPPPYPYDPNYEIPMCI